MATPSPRSRTRPAPPAGTLLLLVRHGTTPTTGKVLPGRARGLHLADSGRAQAETVAARIAEWVAEPKGPKITAVYASPLERTRETAAPIAKALGLKVTAERGLLECDFGEWTGKELKDLGKLPEWTTVQRFPSGFRFPEGESFVGMQARMVDTLGAICARHRGEAVVAVSHADTIKAAVADAMGTPLDLFQRIVISPCSVSVINVGATGPSVLAVNSTGTLKELRPS
jgi:probable phosphomutase (TIGR03848 family)